MWETVAIVGLILCCLLGVLITIARLPGTWLIVAAAFGNGWLVQWQEISPAIVAVLAGLAVIGEAAEVIMSALAARKAGASRGAAWGGLLGGILGMFFLSSMLSLPFPVVGTVIGAIAGALAGCFAGAMLVELAIRKKLAQGTKVGLFSALGFVVGMVTKIALALVMSGLVLTSVVCEKLRQTQ